MQNFFYVTVLLGITLLFAACSTKTVEIVDKKHALVNVCIEDNPKVIVDDFIPVVTDLFDKHGITTQVYYGVDMPKSCEVKMTYTATRHWDITPFLSHAELRLYKEGKKIGYAEYHLTGGGGFDFSKWASVKTKMTPVIEELLLQYKQ